MRVCVHVRISQVTQCFWLRVDKFKFLLVHFATLTKFAPIAKSFSSCKVRTKELSYRA